jgi:hypothetical protein
MFRENSNHQQMKLFSTLNDMHPRLKKKLEHSWAQVFYDHIFCKIDESQFALLYCSDNGRPNFPVNILICLEAIKHLFDYTDEEILEQYAYNYQVNYAVGVLTLGELPLAERTFYEFRERVFKYTLEHPGEADIVFKQFEGLLDHFLKITKTSAIEQRTDSTFITPNIRRAGRLSLAYDVLVQGIRSIPEDLRTDSLSKALAPGYKTDLLFRTKSAEVAGRLQEMLGQIHELLKIADTHPGLKTLQPVKLAERFLKEQTYYDFKQDSYSARNNKEIEATSLQSAYDQDATYRRKGSKQAVGYVLNITETCGEKNNAQFITDYHLEQNVSSDQGMLEERLPDIKERTGAEDIYADGGYYGEDVLVTADKNNVNLHYTNMTGKGPNKLPLTSFAIEGLKTIRRCPRNSVPFRTNYNEENGTLSAHFPLADCKACPFHKECWVKIGKSDAVMTVERKSILAAREREKLERKEIRIENTSKRAAIEGTMSALKRDQGARKLRVRGRIKCALNCGLKVIARNFRQLVISFQRAAVLNTAALSTS